MTEKLDDSTARRRETPHPPVLGIVTGHFHEGPSYDNWRPRGTRDFLLIYTLAGAGRIGLGGGERRVGPGEIVLWRPGARQEYGTARGEAHWEILWTHFLPRPHWLEWLGWPEVAPGLLWLDPPEGMREPVEAALWRMHRRATGAQPRREEFALHALEEALLWCDRAAPAPARLDPRVARAIAYLRERGGETVTMKELAAHTGLSVSRLAARFRAEVGQTPQQFHEQERLLRARRLLELTARPVAAVAADVGFANPLYFTRRFRRQVGMSPREYRHRLASGEGRPERGE